jgi:hypothetical protein
MNGDKRGTLAGHFGERRRALTRLAAVMPFPRRASGGMASQRPARRVKTQSAGGRFAQIPVLRRWLGERQVDPLLPFPVGARYGRTPRMSGPSRLNLADWGWHLG